MTERKRRAAWLLQNVNNKSCKDFTLKVLPFLELCAIQEKLRICQYQRWGRSYPRNFRKRNLLSATRPERMNVFARFKKRVEGLKETLTRFRTWLRKRIAPWRFGLTIGQTLREGLEESCNFQGKTYTSMSRNNAAFAERNIRSLEVFLSKHQRLNIKISLTCCVSLSQLRTLEGISPLTGDQKQDKIRLFVLSLQQTATRLQKTQVWNWSYSSPFYVWFEIAEKSKVTIYASKFWTCRDCF